MSCFPAKVVPASLVGSLTARIVERGKAGGTCEEYPQ